MDADNYYDQAGDQCPVEKLVEELKLPYKEVVVEKECHQASTKQESVLKRLLKVIFNKE